MICQTCGGRVFWMGPCGALTHTECEQCGAHNNQLPEPVESDLPAADSEGGDYD